MAFSKQMTENLEHFKKVLQTDKNFDVVYRVIDIAGRKGCLFCVDGFTKDEVLLKVLQSWWSIQPDDMPEDADGFSRKYMPYGEVGVLDQEKDVVVQLLSGITCIFLDGYDKCLTLDCRTYPARGVGEPEKDKVMRGSRDGFVETLIFNTALIRRRIRDPRLTMEILSAGESSHTDIAVCYMDGRVDENLLKGVKKRIQQLHADALTMNQESLAEGIYPYKWYNPFPKFKYTERPDTAAAQLLEGDIVLFVDNSPQAMILPVTLFDIVEEANDYYFPPLTGTYLRLTRLFTTLFTLLFTPLWLYFLANPHLLPSWLSFILLNEPPKVPIIAQLLILELAIDGLRLASLNTPNMLTTSLSMIGAIVVGDFAVQSGWFSPETMLYMAFVAIATHTQPGYELGYALKFMRLLLLILTALFPAWGLWLGLALIFIILLSNKTIGRKSYLYPLIPFNYADFKKKVLRIKID